MDPSRFGNLVFLFSVTSASAGCAIVTGEDDSAGGTSEVSSTTGSSEGRTAGEESTGSDATGTTDAVGTTGAVNTTDTGTAGASDTGMSESGDTGGEASTGGSSTSGGSSTMELCAAYADNLAACYGYTVEEGVGFCLQAIEEAHTVALACGVATEDYYACLGANDCATWEQGPCTHEVDTMFEICEG